LEAAPLTLTARRTRISERLGVVAYFDGWLLAAAFGLIGFSIFTLAVATPDAVQGQPLFFAIRQSVYAAVGIALMLAISRIDYTRFREIRVGIYSLMIASIVLVLMFGAAARGSRRWIELPFFRFQPSELAKLLLIVALAAFVIDRNRRGTPLRQTLRMLALGLAPAALVFLQPDRGHHTHNSFPRRRALEALRGDRRAGGCRRQLRPGDRAGRRPAQPTSRLPAGPTDCIPAPQQ
jgi:cell division protein FtsW (lipid II flippase)